MEMMDDEEGQYGSHCFVWGDVWGDFLFRCEGVRYCVCVCVCVRYCQCVSICVVRLSVPTSRCP